MREPFSRWALPPLPPGAGSAERRWRAREERRLVHRLRWIWHDLCLDTDIGRRGAPSGLEPRAIPRIVHVVLGPPTRFSVELLPGQRREDFLALRRPLASAYGVDDVDVRDLALHWIAVELVEGLPAPTTPVVTTDRASPPAPRHGPIVAPGHRLPSRRRRGPSRRPRPAR